MSVEATTTNSEANPAGTAEGAAEATATTQEAAPAAGKTYSQEAYSALQSEKDRALNEARRIREDSERAIQEAREAGRQATLATLKPEERRCAWRICGGLAAL